MDPISDNYDDPYANLYQTPKRPNLNSSNGNTNIPKAVKNNNFNQQGENKKVFNPYGNKEENIREDEKWASGESKGTNYKIIINKIILYHIIFLF
jgi:hypothetical protein